MITDLSSYGTGLGLASWTLDELIEHEDPDRLQRTVERARSLLNLYGPWNGSLQGFPVLVTDMVYSLAEAVYYRNRNIQAIRSPFKMEKIGSYSYDKGNQKNNMGLGEFLEGDSILWAYITHLQQSMDVIRVGIRVEELLDYNPQTGLRDIVLSHNNRVARRLNALGYVSDTAEFNAVVYGDRNMPWAWEGAVF